MIDEREDRQDTPPDEPQQDEGPDVSELGQDPAHNPEEAGLEELEKVRGG